MSNSRFKLRFTGFYRVFFFGSGNQNQPELPFRFWNKDHLEVTEFFFNKYFSFLLLARFFISFGFFYWGGGALTSFASRRRPRVFIGTTTWTLPGFFFYRVFTGFFLFIYWRWRGERNEMGGSSSSKLQAAGLSRDLKYLISVSLSLSLSLSHWLHRVDVSPWRRFPRFKRIFVRLW